MSATVSLWPSRWPGIAKQECIDVVEAAALESRAEVKWQLPCSSCSMQTRCLNSKRKELGPLLYDREILTSPRSSESSLFPMELFEPLLKRGESCVRTWQKPFSAEDRYAICSAYDLAWSEKIGGDYWVRMTGVLDRKTGVKRLMDLERRQRLTFDDQIQLISANYEMWQDDLVVIESDAAQKVWVQHLARNSRVPVMEHSAAGKQDLAKGIPKLLIELETKKWAFPFTPGTYHFDEVKVFLSECESFGWHEDKLEGVGEHDDTVMAWYHLAWGLDRLQIAPGKRQHRRGVVEGRHV